MQAQFYIIIPARFESSRFPGKPLAKIANKPMIQHVYEKALQSGAYKVIIATDDVRIQKSAIDFGAEVCMTAPEHKSGTDRLAEVVRKLKLPPDTIIVNVQGDEPLIPPKIIQQTANDLAMHIDAEVATLCEPLEHAEQLFAPNIAKVVFDANRYALFFSRAPIPWDREHFPLAKDAVLPKYTYFRHLGIYAYRAGFLQKFVKWDMCPIEKLECLEQLRMLWNGVKIYVGEAHVPSMIGVDTPTDLAKVQSLFKE